MITQTYSLSNNTNFQQSQQVNENSFGRMLFRVLGEQAWSRLEPAIKQRFTTYEQHDHSIKFKGKMQWVYCSPIGVLIAKIIKPFSILPDLCTRNVDFLFNIYMQNSGIAKQRVYNLGINEPFIFNSKFSDQPRLHEEFGGGIGMYLHLAVKRGSLLFQDQGYFLRIKNWRLPLPRWMSVGKFELLHQNINDQRFQIIIRVTHPLLGTLFYQRGVFYKLMDHKFI